MGKYNSSMTRVRPVFNALYDRDPTGRSWLPFLLALGSRSSGTFPDLGDLIGPPKYEFEADPDPRYLLWLVSNPDPCPARMRPIGAAGARQRSVRGEGFLREIPKPGSEQWPISPSDSRLPGVRGGGWRG